MVRFKNDLVFIYILIVLQKMEKNYSQRYEKFARIFVHTYTYIYSVIWQKWYNGKTVQRHAFFN
jgi:hypothetical protein